MKVKICGLSTTEQVQTSIKYGADFCGFILNYPKSHRFIEFEKAKELTKIEKEKTKYVAVLVNPNENELEKFSKLNIDYFQIYGNYNSNLISNIKSKFNKKIIVTIQVKNEKDVLNYKQFQDVADIILWDSSGLEYSLDWNFNWIHSVPNNITKMIAGNINIDKLKKILKLADIVDVSGSLETNKVKDIIKIKNFLNSLKKLNNEN
ncbi:phosphoribosylanthranilate isomerase [Candidatus Pelagibacter sp.]|nr:phosphoribosylanthranilate isomerase [Candidatus Pelagibacter sp.]